MARVGLGFDVHRLVEGRPLWLCGVNIQWNRGLLGHSDADVAIHALCDALLGAASLRDIGYHFPDTDPRYKGIDSRLLLQQVMKLLDDYGYGLVNCDITICAEQPKLSPHIPAMINELATCMGCDPGQVSVKATTTEKLGYTGRGEGIAAHAIAMIETKSAAQP
jgi:2-C-methyl-D-erythritol 2,4-cyclodiphosphate synthase